MPNLIAGLPQESTGLTGSSRNSFIGRFKDEYLPKLDDHVHDKLVVAGLIAKKRGSMGGQRSIGSFLSVFPQSAGISLFEGDTLPTPRASEYANPTIIERTCYSRLRWSGHVERAAAKGDKVAWAQPRAEDMRAARKQLELNYARQLYLGPYQALATCTAVTTADPDVTIGARNARTSAANDRWKYGAHYLRENMSLMSAANNAGAVDAGSAVGAIANAGTELFVSSINLTGAEPVVTLSGNATVAVNDILVPYGSRRSSVANGLDLSGAIGADAATIDSFFAGPNGLLNLVVDQSYKAFVYGLDRATYPTLEGFVLDAAGVPRAWDEDYIMLAADRVQDDGTGGDPTLALCHRSIRRQYIRETASDRRFLPVQKKKGYAGQLTFQAGDVPLSIFTDRDCPPGLMFILNADGMGWFEHASLQMVDEGERFVANEDAHEIVMVKSGNEMCAKPHDNAVVEDIIYDVSDLV